MEQEVKKNIVEYQRKHAGIGDLFSYCLKDLQDVQVVEEIPVNGQQIHGNDTDVLVVVRKTTQGNEDHSILGEFRDVNNAMWELRFGYNEKIDELYVRHGGHAFPSWWVRRAG